MRAQDRRRWAREDRRGARKSDAARHAEIGAAPLQMRHVSKLPDAKV